MAKSITEYILAVLKWWWVVVMGGFFATIGASVSIWRGIDIPVWVWIGLAVFGLFIAQFFAFHKLRVERDNLKQPLNDKAKRRAMRETLAEFLKEGEQIKRQCRNEKEKAPKKEALDWAEKVAKYLTENLGSDYEATFYNSDGLPVGFTVLSSPEHQNIEAYMKFRIARLQQFLTELRG